MSALGSVSANRVPSQLTSMTGNSVRIWSRRSSNEACVNLTLRMSAKVS
jgi:hypothetical protein